MDTPSTLREKAKAGQRVVFKTVFDSPYAQWPPIEEALGKELLSRLLQIAARSRSLPSAAGKRKAHDPSLLVGLNQVTRGLERGTVSAVFACKEDVNPAMLFAHLPFLCTLKGARLVALPRESSAELSSVLLIKNVFIIGLCESELTKSIYELLRSRIQAQDPSCLSKYRELQIKKTPVVIPDKRSAKRAKTSK